SSPGPDTRTFAVQQQELLVPAANRWPMEKLLATKPDSAKGKTVFQKAGCIACHIVQGEGLDFGPELSDISTKLNSEQLFTAILNPNQTISLGHEGVTVCMKDGTQLVGYVTSDSETTLSLRIAGGLRKDVPKANIKTRQAMKISLMPTSLDAVITSRELVDLVGWLAAQKTQKTVAATEPDFTSIFNGMDLTGWEGDDKAWTVRNGAIQSTGGKTKKNWLIWRGGELRNFELRLSFKFTKGNSGVQVRSKEIAKWQVRGYQVEIADATKMGLWHHSLAPEKYRSQLATAGQRVRIGLDGKKKIEQRATPAKVQSACLDNEWNELVVTAMGSRLVQTINGIVFTELVDEDAKHSARSGLLALQDHGKGCVAAFKDIRIKHLQAKAPRKKPQDEKKKHR
ncbi:MAG: DUF1080 domain-containing protein, partial [Verrucomicrobiota bacterium]|nr:DUF1080 domain-containing protein [Verrucomicrobiota bacterium]